MTERGMLLVRGLPLRVRGRTMRHGQEGVCVIAAAVHQRLYAQLSYSYEKQQLQVQKIIKSSPEKHRSAIIVHKPNRTATSTTVHRRQNKPY